MAQKHVDPVGPDPDSDPEHWLPVTVSFRLFGLLPTLTDRHEATVVDWDQACSNGVSPKKMDSSIMSVYPGFRSEYRFLWLAKSKSGHEFKRDKKAHTSEVEILC